MVLRPLGRDEQLAIYDALQQGKSITQVHEELGYDRSTIRQVKQSGDPTPRVDTPSAPRRPSLLAPYHEYIRERVRTGCVNTAV